MSDPKEFFERVGTERGYGGTPVSMSRMTANSCVQAVEGESSSRPLSLTGDRRWAASHDTFWGATQTYDQLPPGLYRCDSAPQIGPILIRQTVDTDKLLELPDDACASIIDEFEAFWTLGAEFRARGFLHKRGFLLWGPPGSGKTSCVQLLVKRLIETYSGIVLFLENPGTASACLSMVRKIEPKRPVIAIMEDLDALIQNFGENDYLALLDGEAQVDNIVFVATTNYPERLDKRFVDRPSRFDTIKYVGMPSAQARRIYFQAKEPALDESELSAWVSATDGFSIAHLKELIISVKCFKQPLENVIERLEAMHARRPSSEDSPDRAFVGFTVERRFKNGAHA